MIRRSSVKTLCALFLGILSGFSQNNSSSNKQIDSILIVVSQNLNKGNLEIAQTLLNQAQELNVNSTDAFYLLKLNFHQATIHIKNEDDELALELLLQGYSEIKKLDTSPYHSLYAQEMGQIFGRSEDFNSSLDYFEDVVAHAKIIKDSLKMSSGYLNIGSIYQMKQEIDVAEYYYKKVMSFYPKSSQDKETLATAYGNLIGIAVSSGEFNLAETYGKKSLILHEQRKDTLKIAGVLSNLGSINMYTKNLELSNEYYFRAHGLLVNRKDLKSREIVVLTLDNISQVFYLQGNFKTGYDYLFESASLEKLLIADKMESKISEVAAKFDLAEKEKSSNIEKRKREKAELLLYVFIFSTFFLLILIWFYMRTSKLNREKKELKLNQEKVAQAREIEKIQSEVQIKILNATLDGKEAERRHISEILQDNVSTLLSSANLHLYAVKIGLGEKSPPEIEKIASIINETSDKVRDLSHKLISTVLLRFGLKTSIEDLCEKYSNSRLAFKFKAENINRYNQSFEIKTHNIVEELMNNIMKHSNAYKASITIEDNKEVIYIRIIDDGDGFDIKDMNKTEGLGLSHINARVKDMKGSIEIKSYENTGTQIYIEIPIPK
jgi:two-component system NarL family sensor kinase